MAENDKPAAPPKISDVIASSPAPRAPVAKKAEAQAPTVGRIVFFKQRGHNLAAIVVYVHDDGTVNLAAFPGNADVHIGRTRIAYGDGDGQWSWPTKV